jgi:hypothetical protein
MLKLYCASQWKIYAREHAQTLLRVLDERPDLVRFWRGAYTPNETCVVTMFSSPPSSSDRSPTSFARKFRPDAD